ncbi:hypothetical protein AABB24_004194, partial [Solanum stoloniferum]
SHFCNCISTNILIEGECSTFRPFCSSSILSSWISFLMASVFIEISFSLACKAFTHASAASTFLSAISTACPARPFKYSYSNLEIVIVEVEAEALLFIVTSLPQWQSLFLSQILQLHLSIVQD